MDISPPHFFFWYNVRSLVRSNIVWNTMMMNKALRKSEHDSIGMVGKESKSKFRSIVYSSEDKSLIPSMSKEVYITCFQVAV